MVYNKNMNFARVKAWFSHHHVFLLFIVATIIIFAVNLSPGNKATAPTPPKQTSDSSMPEDGAFLTIVGEFVCLPHKDTAGPQTEECAFGLKSEDTYYALQDSTADNSLVNKGVVGTNVRVGGTFKARGDSKYQDIGVVTVSSLDPAGTTDNPATPQP